MNWRESVEGYEKEAAAVLKGYRLPADAVKLAKRNAQPKDRLEGAAMLVIYGAHHLRKELERGRIEEALDRLTQVYDSYLEMWFLKKVPEYKNGVVVGDSPLAKNSLVRDIREPKLKQKRAIDSRHKADREAKEKAISLCKERQKERPKDKVGEITNFVKVALEKEDGSMYSEYSEKTIRTWIAKYLPPEARKGGRPRNST